MRTTSKQQAVLLREARQALGLKRNAAVYPALQPIVDAVQARLGGGTVSHYRGNSWGVTWIGPGGQDCFEVFKAIDFQLSPAAFVEKVLGPHQEWSPESADGAGGSSLC